MCYPDVAKQEWRLKKGDNNFGIRRSHVNNTENVKNEDFRKNQSNYDYVKL